MASVTIDEIRAAAVRIAPIARKTPVWTSGSFDRRSGCEVFFKCENLQKGGAFKIRGASNFLYSMTPEQRALGVVGFSSGNHAQAVAIAARKLGVKATLIMPDDAPKSKLAATRANGANVITYDRLKESREAIGRKISEETGAMLVPPFDHPWIVAGAGTCALELLEQAPTLDALVVCLGGGGLLAGSAIAAKALKPSIRIFGVEPELGNDYWLSRREGKPVEIDSPATIADGLRTTKPGALTFPIIQELVEDVLLVTEDEIKETTKFVMTRMKLLVEPSGVVGASAVLHGKLPKELRRIGVILSGGNVDLEVLATL
ncbi:pyridoxal-phosphate dependent enzyme [uncultured Paludibaculum sp.]|uniref:pyridoxal-phosphate dependent enzyme n=1 Tax=uncultured Paludibaculum sp. TaxID=1765020 RepID=UPI002AAB7FAE|nr:pyridoxal-phosphate dependent enzyme [uncultured Paludibaculum sp.]